MSLEVKHETSIGFCIYLDTLIEGSVPVERHSDLRPFTYSTRQAAEREIAEDTIERIQQFLMGEREFDDAMTIEEYVVEVDILRDGSIVDEFGNHFNKNT